MIPTLLLDLLLTLTIPAFRLPILIVSTGLLTLPGLLILAIHTLLLPLSFGLVSADTPDTITVRSVLSLVLAVLPFALAVTVALTLLLLPVSLFGLTLLILSLTPLLGLALLLLPGFVPLLNLLAPLSTPNSAVLPLLLRAGRDRSRRGAPLLRLLSLTLLLALGPLLLTLLLALGLLLLFFGALLLSLFATLVSAPLSIDIGAKPGHHNASRA